MKFNWKIFTKNNCDVLARPLVIALDFDGTCVAEEYPKVGKALPGVVQTLHAFIAHNHKLILWTCREGKELKDAVNWFKEREIVLYAVNETPAEYEFRTPPGRKVLADLYIDDRSFGKLPDWSTIHLKILGKKLKPW